MSEVRTARASALEVLLAHFPNPSFLMLGIDKLYGAEIAEKLPEALAGLRMEMERELGRITSTANTTNP